jgi:hypothetical protein
MPCTVTPIATYSASKFACRLGMPWGGFEHRDRGQGAFVTHPTRVN